MCNTRLKWFYNVNNVNIALVFKANFRIKQKCKPEIDNWKNFN